MERTIQQQLIAPVISPGGKFIFCASLFCLLGCAGGPSVRLVTPEPIQVDLNMRVDVYQHSDGASKPAQATGQTPQPAASTPESRRRNRLADIQEFKNSRIVGEGKDGLLAVIERPPGEFGDYVVKMVTEENVDRMEVMQAVAESTQRSVTEVQAEQGAEWRRRAFVGEWIEVPLEEEEGFQWKQKGK